MKARTIRGVTIMVETVREICSLPSLEYSIFATPKCILSPWYFLNQLQEPRKRLGCTTNSE